MYKVVLHKQALKQYVGQDKRMKARLDKALENLKINPKQHRQIKRLTGALSNLYRYRVGNLRILYEMHENLKVVRVKAIVPRGQAYRRPV